MEDQKNQEKLNLVKIGKIFEEISEGKEWENHKLSILFRDVKKIKEIIYVFFNEYETIQDKILKLNEYPFDLVDQEKINSYKETLQRHSGDIDILSWVYRDILKIILNSLISLEVKTELTLWEIKYAIWTIVSLNNAKVDKLEKDQYSPIWRKCYIVMKEIYKLVSHLDGLPIERFIIEERGKAKNVSSTFSKDIEINFLIT